jgi:hypothetical protein
LILKKSFEADRPGFEIILDEPTQSHHNGKEVKEWKVKEWKENSSYLGCNIAAE